MNLDLGLRVLGSIMDWDDDKARVEFQRLRLMANLKYDGYRDFEAGVRFIESLAAWLQQFRPDQRPDAYEFVAHRLVYIGPSEMEKLVGQFYTNVVHPEVSNFVAAELGLPRYRIQVDGVAQEKIKRHLRRTLFLGLSDGARVDYIRHQNVGLIRNEQVVGSTQIDTRKWQDLLEELREDLDDSGATFRSVYLIDDFAATGTSFFRLADGKPKGKLVRFATSIKDAEAAVVGRIFDEDYRIHIHHYVGTSKARQELGERLASASETLRGIGLPTNPTTTYGIVLPETLPLSASDPRDQAFLKLVEEYYDPTIHTRHTEVGGTTDMKLGYGGCALPLILDHNTPNNSLPLLWAETVGTPDGPDSPPVPPMRPLFRRRQRHL